jgi:glucose-6-phosphate 1-dehydrogenase
MRAHAGFEIMPVDMVSPAEAFGNDAHLRDAPARLHDRRSDSLRSDEVEMAWSIIDPILDYWISPARPCRRIQPAAGDRKRQNILDEITHWR